MTTEHAELQPPTDSVELTKGSPPWGWRELGLVLALMAAGWAVLMLIGIGLASGLNLPASETIVSPIAYISGMGIYLTMIGAIYWVVVRKAGWAALGLRAAAPQHLLLVVPMFILGLIGLVTTNLLISMWLGSFENPQIDAITGGNPLSPGELAAGFLLIALVAPFAEELFFRGLLYPLLRARLSALAAIVINAALFALIHGSPLLIPGLFVFSLPLVFLRERSDSLWPCVIYHTIQNSLALLSINMIASL